MNFIKWYFKTTWFHIIWMLGLLGYTISWTPGDDKTIAIFFLLAVIIVLTVGKFNYWKDHVREK